MAKLDQSVKILPSVIRKFEFKIPERYRNTFVEKWANYWKNLYTDYKEVAVETVQNARQKPLKAVFICSGLGFLAYCGRSNPSEQAFRDSFLFHANEMAMVGESVRNPASVNHLTFIEKCYNSGILRKMNLGIVSFLWISDYDKSSGLFQAHCDYLGPKFLNFHNRIIDIGFLGQWWLLQRAMIDFDVNPTEFKYVQES